MQPTRLALFSQKIITIGLWIVLITAPLLLNPYLTQLTITEKATTLGSIILIMAMAGLLLISEQHHQQAFGQQATHFIKQPLIIPVLLFLGALLISTIFAINPWVSFWGGYHRLGGVYFWLLYSLIFFLVRLTIHTPEQRQWCIRAIVLTSIPVVIHGIVQYFDLDPLLILGIDKRFGNRVLSMLGNPIFLGSYLIMVMPLTFAIWLKELSPLLDNPTDASTPRYGQLYLQIGYGLLLSLQGITLLLTQSRGPIVGLLIAIFVIGLLLLLHLPAWLGKTSRLWSKGWSLWVGGTLTSIVTIILLNLPIFQPYVAPLRDLPVIGRVTNLSLTERTVQLRTLTWDGGLALFSRDTPIGIPNDDVIPLDSYHTLRPMIGYGSEAVERLYPLVNTVTLDHQEYLALDETDVDKLHNHYFDLLINNGLLGVLTYHLLILAIVYYALQALGWVSNKSARYQLWGFLIGGGLGGIMLVYLLDTDAFRFTFAPLGLTLGTIIGVVTYLVWQKLINDGPSSQLPLSSSLLLIALLGSIIAHFVDLQLSFEHSFTYLYFWVYAGFIVTIPIPTQEQNTTVTEHHNITNQGIIVAIIITTLIFNFMLVGNNYYWIIIGLSLVTYGFGWSQLWIVLQRQGTNKPFFPILRAYSAFAIGGSLIYGGLHWGLTTWWLTTPYTVYGTRIWLQLGIIVLHLLMLIGVIGGYAILNIRSLPTRVPIWKSNDVWFYAPLLLLLCPLIWVNHVSLSQADIYYTQSRLFEDKETWHIANLLLKQAHSLNPQSFYQTLIVTNLQKQAQQNKEEKNYFLKQAEQNLKEIHHDNPYSLKDLFRLGSFYLLQQPNPTQAIHHFEQAIALAPAHIENYLQLGAVYHSQGEYEQAEVLYQKVFQYDSYCVKAWNALGDVYISQGEVTKALESHQNAIRRIDRCGDGFKIFSQNQQLFERYLQFYSQHGQGHAMIEALEQVALQPYHDYEQRFGHNTLGLRNDERIVTVGYAYLMNNQPEKAIIYLEKMYQVAENPSVQLSKALAQTYLQLDEPAKTAEIYDTLIYNASPNLALQNELAQLYEQYEQTDRAIAQYERMLKVNPDDKETLFRLAKLYQTEQDWSNYLAISEKILAITPPNEQTAWLLMMTQAMLEGGSDGIDKFADNVRQFLDYFVQQNKVAEFIKQIETIAADNIDNATIQAVVGHIYYITGNLNLALPYLEKALALDSHNLLALENMAQIHMTKNELTKAQPLFEQLVEQIPDDADLHIALAYIYGHQKQYDKAIEHNTTILALTPDNYRALINLMVIYQSQKKWAEALEAAQQALTLASEAEHPQIEQFIAQMETKIQEVGSKGVE